MITIKENTITILNTTKNTNIKNIIYSKSIARNTKGLMFKKTGRMLMKFERDGKQGIWMPFMKFNLDLIFIDRSKKIIDIKYDVKPLKILKPSTWKLYTPKEKCRYVLEIESGLSKNKQFETQDEIKF